MATIYCVDEDNLRSDEMSAVTVDYVRVVLADEYEEEIESLREQIRSLSDDGKVNES